jgi:RNA polymerase sigma-54 factor
MSRKRLLTASASSSSMAKLQCGRWSCARSPIFSACTNRLSRVTSQKYMATPRGIFELKYFFGSHVATDTGGACSATAIRALIKQLVGAEDGKKPLSDSQLSEILGQQGIVVARRTVAKYRESLNIPPVNLRKTL